MREAPVLRDGRSVSLPDRLVINGFSSTPFRNRIDPVTLKIRVSDTRGRLVQVQIIPG